MKPIRHHDSDTGHALMCAVLANPFDMLVRLVYADWLEENGQAERAEFIRLQIQIEDIREQTGGCEPPTVFTRRETDLFNRNHGRWFWRDGRGEADGFGLTITGDNPSGRWLHVRNGFGEEVRCPLAWWADQVCNRCHGDRCPSGYEGCYCCPECNGTGTTPGHGAEVVSRHPVTRVVVTDREPSDYHGVYCWRQADEESGGEMDRLPSPVFDRVGGNRVVVSPDMVLRAVGTREAAVEALSRDLVDLARSRAGLPKLEWEVTP